MHDIIVLIEHQVRIDTAELAEEAEKVVSEREHGNGVAKLAEHPREAANLPAKIGTAAAIVGTLRHVS
jgi:hypothetical protein